MRESGQLEDGGVIEPGLFTRLRPFAGWALVANMIAGIAWGICHLF